MDKPRELLRPVRKRWIALSLALALVVELLPLSGPARLTPDFVALLVLYWNINQPSRFGIGLSFLVDLIGDFFSAGLIGQHALAYTVISYLVLLRQRQIAMYSLGQQALIVLGLLLLSQAIMWLARMALGGVVVGWSYFMSPFVGALLWPLLTTILLWPQRSGSSRQPG